MPVLILMRRPIDLKPNSLRTGPSDAAGAFFARFPRFDGLAILHSSSSKPRNLYCQVHPARRDRRQSQ